MYQGSQTLFKIAGRRATTCSGRVAASMAISGFCYLAADDNVMCAGWVGGIDYGPSFTAIGMTGAVQIMVMFSDNGICVTRTDHTVWCMGSNTEALGASGASSTFVQWTERDDIAAITTGLWHQLCGITFDGQVLCGGMGFGNPPVEFGSPGRPECGSTRSMETRFG